jgi:hypothetical protein
MKGRPPLMSDYSECNGEGDFRRQLYPVLHDKEQSQAPYFDRPIHGLPHSLETETQLDISQFIHDDAYTDNTNQPHQYYPESTFGTDKDTSETCGWQRDPASRDLVQNEGDELRDVENYIEAPRPRDRNLEPRRGADFTHSNSSYRPLASAPNGNSPHMHIASIHPSTRGASRYEPFAQHFPNSQSASQHRKHVMRFGRKPYRPPESDGTIGEIEANRIHHVERIYNAMTCGAKARDNDTSPAMKRWVHAAYYESHLVESIAHKVLDCLFSQVKDGYRGWKHTDYVADDRKGEDEDRDISCAGRLDNIIRALEEEKTICEDVMQSACQIRMFVNAPKAYANRKHQNRLGNRKRGQTKDDDNPRPMKALRTKRAPTFTLQPTPNHRQYLNSHTPEPRTQRFGTPLIRASASPSIHGLPFQRMTPAVNHAVLAKTPVAQMPPYDPRQLHQLNPISPPSLHASQMQSMSPCNGSAYMSPPPLVQSTSVSPDDTKHPHNPGEVWPSMQVNSPYGYPVDPALFDDIYPPWESNALAYSGSNANLFDQDPDAASLPMKQQGETPAIPNIQEYWETTANNSYVQPFPQLPRNHHSE